MKTTGKAKKQTPLMAQYNQIKAKYPDAILFFRVGDFYETFSNDAITTAGVLGIVLTKRANGSASHVELAGFPHHALDTYLPKMVRAGYRVAICEQLEDPKTTRKLVKRGVTELITPGVALNDQLLDHKSNNFLASVNFGDSSIGASFLDVSTGEFYVSEGSADQIDNLLQSLTPSEVILPKSKVKEFRNKFGEKFYTYPLEDWIFSDDFARDKLLNHFETRNLKGFGIEAWGHAIIAAGAAIHYLGETEHKQINHISSISRLTNQNFVWLDQFTIRNLEILRSNHENGVSLLQVLDKTISPMGGRLLKNWLIMPRKDVATIAGRHDAVEELILDQDLHKLLCDQIKLIGDLERLISKVPTCRINPREVNQLKCALNALIPIKKACAGAKSSWLKKSSDQFNLCRLMRERIANEIVDDPPVQISKGQVFQKGINSELDELRSIGNSGKEFLVDLQKREALSTGISSLKIGYNNVFGYYLAVTNRYKDKVPERWIRKQTLVNEERYITEELKELETKILGAEEKILKLETTMFEELVYDLNEYIKPIQYNAGLVAQLDCLQCFAGISLKNNYCRPQITEDTELDIKDGRHPVIEQQLDLGESYVPNDLFLDTETQQIIILTGPNMSGKSALLRQTALIVLMAQAGCYVPASSARIGIVDKIFTRVGASDNISSGESTFMVEMNETASIMNNVSMHSLILLDEIGRGTSTYDGISIAWSLAEYLHQHKQFRPKTLFATHYHELNELSSKFPRIHNYHIATKESGNKVIFLRKFRQGGSKHSFGIHVASMAGMPETIVNRANEILTEMEKTALGNDIGSTLKLIPEQNYQLNIFQVDDPNLAKIKDILMQIDINTMTPVDAFMKLNELKMLMKNTNSI